MNKQLLILPDKKRFKSSQMKELNEAGFVVIYLPDPSKARVMSAELLPIAGDDVLVSALKAVRRADDWSAYRTFLDGLIAAATSPPRDGGKP